ncbi:hypothetical protein DNTS_007279 [Danionella cerebrum]|uniref:Phosphatidic acid phosphatase type 2/haloperoxidase domain-containing protein n=1 Tax=Danionella cerebrum TaxID=2873325 RepID=A0A553RJ22_9TELE|nr:hypothetical protein DNTS_007279 [Danionella translucida]
MADDGLHKFIGLCRYLQDPCHVARFQRFCGVRGTFSRKTPTEVNDSGARLSVNGASLGQCHERAASGDAAHGLPEQRLRKSLNVDSSISGPTERVKPLRRNSLTGDVGQEFIIENKFLFYLFTVGTELGNEMFFIIFFPFLMWNVDPFVSRQLIVVWAWVLFLGQSTKDVVRWTRPASPPVVKVEVFYNSEYSMPSTHAMSGTALPFSLFLLTCSRWEHCHSREVITGFLYSVLILAILHPMLDDIDTFYLTHSYAPPVVLLVHVGFSLVAFSLDTWSTSRGDTAQALATAAGAALACRLNQQLGLLPDPSEESLPLSLPLIDGALLSRSVMRMLVGVAVLLAVRAAMKVVAIPVACKVFGVPSDDVRKARQHAQVELAYRFIVYGTVAYSCAFLVPLLFGLLGLS